MAAISQARTYRFVVPVEARADLVVGPQIGLPGVYVDRSKGINCPENAVEVLRALFDELGLVYSITDRGPRERYGWEDILNRRELNDLAIDFLERTSYQRAALIHSCNRNGAMLAHSTGSGKSLVGAAWGLAVPGPLLFTTKASARGTLVCEIKKFTRDADYHLIEGFTPYVLPRARIYVIGAECLSHWVDQLLAIKPASLVLDECHKFQNSRRYTAMPLNEDEAKAIEKGQRRLSSGEFLKREALPEGSEPWELGNPILFQPVKSMAAAAARIARSIPRRLVMSATPIPDRVRNLWAQLDCAEPKAWGSSRFWLSRYAGARPGKFGGMDASGKTHQQELQTRLSVIQHVVTKAEANKDLPPLRRVVIRLKQEDLNEAAAGFSARDAKRIKTGGERREFELMRLASMKRNYLVTNLVGPAIESKHKILILTGRRKEVDRLQADIAKKFGDVLNGALWAGHGGDSDKARDAMRDAYMASEGPAVLVGTMDAFGESYNLQDSDDLFLPMLPYTPRLLIQSEGRVQRLGQMRPVLVYYLMAVGTLDERVALHLLDKLPAIERLAGDPEAGHILRALQGSDEEIMADLMQSITAGLEEEAALDRIGEGKDA